MRASLVLVLAACGAADPEGSDTDDPGEACVPPSLALDRADVATGYLAGEAAVDAPWLEAPRTVPTGLWYPTSATEGTAAVYLGGFPDPRSLVDAPFADPQPGCQLPLVVYSHGSQAWGGNLSPVLRHLVAQGFVAAAPDHVGNTTFDNLDPRPTSFPRTRTADVLATIDALAALPEEHPLHGRIDTSRVVVLGHSFGGQTSWLLSGPTFATAALADSCADEADGCTPAELAAYDAPLDDPRIVGVIPLDGFAWEDVVAPDGWASRTVPALFLAKSSEGDSSPFERVAAASDVPITWARFEGACHETFTSNPVPCPGFDKEEGLDLTARLVTAFVARTLLDSDDPAHVAALDGSDPGDPRVTLLTSP